ncbi:HAD family hydrolase [Proteinivorax tanatarense]|uniref:HAD family hydrolase n=1 Tax=Proteinivorax tanatarense TaxID=1260629 RepID=A0AAU7VJH2_9FIRM
MLKAVLFDLDGTLLKLNVDSFLPRYVESISEKVKHKIPSKQFKKALFAGTEKMVENVEPNKTNKDVFMETFFSLTKADEKEILPVFDEFYSKEFSKLQKDIKAVEGAKEVVEFCKNENLKVVLATNPVFPKEATYERVRWADLNIDDFDLVTTYENMTATKPNLNYYQEILNKIDVKAEETLMVGNDCQEDLVVAKLGIKTYLVDDGLVIDRSGGNYLTDYQGPLKDLPKVIKKINIYY